jgi:pre-rRNA-processing protein TSR3
MSKTYPQTLILRHRRENLQKCSLKNLESREDMLFFTYPIDPLPSLQRHIVLTLHAPLLTQADAAHGLLLIDGTWRLAQTMEKTLPLNLTLRSLPGHYRTAYPRRQTGCSDPDAGLASIEALFIAYLILGRPTDGLLDHYYWKDAFLKLNKISI